MMGKRTTFAWLLALGLLIAACGGDGGTETTTAATEPPPTETTTGGTTATTAAPMEIATDFGVDLEAGVIKVGMLSDLTSPNFSALVQVILAGYQAYWDQVNANGGINGLQVELVTRDTEYEVDKHVQLYNEIKDQVVAIGHSTGSPHTVALITPDNLLAEDDMLVVPLTWYSGWSDDALGANLIPHGTPYCIEAQNTLGYIKTEAAPEAATIAIVSFPGDYGLDSAAGAKIAAEALGLEVVYDGSGAIIPTDPATFDPVADGIANSGADIVWIAANRTSVDAIFSRAAVERGNEGIWSGPSPSFSPALVGPDSAIKDDFAAQWIGGTYTSNWASDAFAAQREAFLAAGAPPLDYYIEGIVEASILHNALLKAYENGDMTRAGVLAAAKSLESVDFGGLAPSESYAGGMNDRVQRKGYIYQPDPEGLAAGTSGGTKLLESEYTSEIAAAFEFTGACYQLG